MTVDITVRDSAFVAGTPRVWADVALRAAGLAPPFDLYPDGKRFLVAAPADRSAQPPLTVVLNWQAGLKP
jgi:hypothetical protein